MKFNNLFIILKYFLLLNISYHICICTYDSYEYIMEYGTHIYLSSVIVFVSFAI